MSIRAAAAATVVAGVTCTSGAQLFFEVESNDTIATAQFLTTFTPVGGAAAVIATKTAGGDVDWYRFNLAEMSTLLISAIGSSDNPGPDTQMQLVAGDGTTIIDWDDDDGPGLLSALNVVGLGAGTYYLGVSAFADVTSSTGMTTLFDGIDEITGLPTDDNFTYTLSIAVNLVPAPSAAALFGIGGLVALRRRR